jgi:hypothetical protein
LDELFRHQDQLAKTPVDVAGSAEDDSELDDHLWLRIWALLTPQGTVEEVEQLAPDLRAYYVTRVYEWERGFADDSFFAHFGLLTHLVADGYRHLGLADAAQAFESLRASRVVRRLLEDDEFIPSDDELQVLSDLSRRVGDHTADRMAFVRARPEVFSI